MRLLEREEPLGALRRAEAGEGSTALVTGPGRARRLAGPHRPRRRAVASPARDAGQRTRAPARAGSVLARAVEELAAGTGRDPSAVYALTRGNPFFVAEALAAPPEEVPASVKDAVLARMRHVSAGCRDAVERLSVVPSAVPDALAMALVTDLEALTEAERAGLVEARPGGIGFRHELARRAIEHSIPGIRKRLLNLDVVRTGMLAGARLLHHAAQAGDVDTLVAEGPAAAREGRARA